MSVQHDSPCYDVESPLEGGQRGVYSSIKLSSRSDLIALPSRVPSPIPTHVETDDLFSRDIWRDCLYHGTIEELRLALKSTDQYLANSPISDYDQNLPLHIAASRGRAHTEILIRAGADVNGTNSSIGTALQWAAAIGSVETVQLLINNGAHVNAKAGWKGTALIAAVRSKNKPTARALLDHEADPNQLDLYRHASPLSVATSTDMIKLLLDHGANVRRQCRDTHVLVKAIQANDQTSVQLLLQHGADPNLISAKVSVLQQSMRLEHLEIAVDLLEYGATLCDRDSSYLIATAIARGDGKLLEAILRCGLDPNLFDPNNGPPIARAASVGRHDLIAVLLRFGADINPQQTAYDSPALRALNRGHLETAAFLLRRGAIIPDASYWSSVHEVVPTLKLWKNVATKFSYGDLAQLFTDYRAAGAVIPITRLEFPWQIPLLLSHEQRPAVSSLQILQNHVVLVRCRTNDKNGDEVLRTEALTCLEYVQRVWGSLGSQVLFDLGHLAVHDNQTAFQRSYKLDDQSTAVCDFHVDIQKSILRLTVDYTKSTGNFSLTSFISLLDWIFRAIRAPSADGLIISSSCWQISSTRAEGDELICETTSEPPTLKFGIQLAFQLQTKPLQKTGNDCWHDLFKSAYVVESQGRSGNEKTFGRGLEMSFQLMAALAGVEYPVIVNEGVVLLGYQTLLVPTRITPDFVQYHLEVNQTGQMNPFTISYGPRALTIDHLAFKTLRCYIGWCEAAHIMLGTQFSSPYEVKYSGSQQRRNSLQLNGISTGFQLTSTTPIQAGVTGQANFALATNRVSFSPSSVYSKMLRDTAKDVALVYDARSRQSWVVPKLSILLHMAHTWIKENTAPQDFESPQFRDPIPFVDPHYDGFAVVAALENAGDIIVCGNGDDALRLRSLLLGLNINMLKISAAVEGADSKVLNGFEFMDVVTEPGRGGMMKKITILSESRNWLKIASVVDLIIVCADLGQAIRPAEEFARKNHLCNALPTGLDWLAMHVSCISQLTKRYGGDLAPTLYSNEIPLSEAGSWKLSPETFQGCKHEEGSRETCWDRTSILQVVRKSGPSRTTANPRRIALSGAVVFGSRNTGIGFLGRT